MPSSRPHALPLPAITRPRWLLRASVDQLIWWAAAFWALVANTGFITEALKGVPAGSVATWGYRLALAAGLTGLHALLLALVATRWTVKPVLAVLVVASAFASFYMQRYGVYLDPSMLRNVVHTNPAEARELITWSLLPHLALQAALPLALLWRVQLVQRPLWRACAGRLATVAGALLLLAGALFAAFQPLSSAMRNHKATRYLVTPANLVWSAGKLSVAQAGQMQRPRQAIGLDAKPGAAWARWHKPRVIVLVVGETARAANWGLNGYARATTPELAALPVINFAHVSSCGTNTEVSLPCMFAPVGRRDYDEDRIRSSESLLHVLQRAGVQVHWRDNQSGCKGVCEGLPQDSVQAQALPQLCDGERCLDEGLLQGLPERLAQARGVQLLVLHQMGNHGPAYSRRYPAGYARFAPACEDADLQHCSREQIVNAYDNALLYTDHLLARLVGTLQAQSDRLDAAMLYVSDHGESLGESGLFLHGMPYPIAPREQTEVPMVMWASDGFARSAGLDLDCLRRRAAEPAAHDHLFHTLLGLADVQTALYEPGLDLTRGCRAAGTTAAAQSSTPSAM
ncbi:MAG: phosphoethanolamine--lipid A transferase [Pseudomonadota bacterium]